MKPRDAPPPDKPPDKPGEPTSDPTSDPAARASDGSRGRRGGAGPAPARHPHRCGVVAVALIATLGVRRPRRSDDAPLGRGLLLADGRHP